MLNNKMGEELQNSDLYNTFTENIILYISPFWVTVRKKSEFFDKKFFLSTINVMYSKYQLSFYTLYLKKWVLRRSI